MFLSAADATINQFNTFNVVDTNDALPMDLTAVTPHSSDRDRLILSKHPRPLSWRLELSISRTWSAG